MLPPQDWIRLCPCTFHRGCCADPPPPSPPGHYRLLARAQDRFLAPRPPGYRLRRPGGHPDDDEPKEIGLVIDDDPLNVDELLVLLLALFPNALLLSSHGAHTREHGRNRRHETVVSVVFESPRRMSSGSTGIRSRSCSQPSPLLLLSLP